jgi:predicted nuclease of predicted toxin-antitoxin system
MHKGLLMRLLLDECLPKRLKRFLENHEVYTVPEMGWAGTKNGVLLRLILKEKFDVFITVDVGIQYQQNLLNVPLRIVALSAFSNRLEDLQPLIKEFLEILPSLPFGIHRIGSKST